MLHRNAGRRTKYHHDADDWRFSGRAQCGADLRTPSHYARDEAEVERSGRALCRRCVAVLEARKVASLAGGRRVRALRSADRTLNTVETPGDGLAGGPGWERLADGRATVLQGAGLAPERPGDGCGRLELDRETGATVYSPPRAALEPCPDCEGRGYVPDVGGEVQACGECQACPDDDEAAGRHAAGLLQGDPYARRVLAALEA